jgi:hypothetical protein
VLPAAADVAVFSLVSAFPHAGSHRHSWDAAPALLFQV